MGTWGLGTFEDDLACDWLEDLHDSDPLAFFVQCLTLTESQELDLLACIGVVCTAEMMHALLREPRSGLPPLARHWVDAHKSLHVLPLLPQAITGLAQVLRSDSEMYQRWEDHQDGFEDWLRQTDDLRCQLRLILVQRQ
jgi:hypothetical protein